VHKDVWCDEKVYYCLGRNISATPFSEECDSRIFSSLSTPMILFSPIYNVIIDVNKSFEHSFGYKRNEMIGRPPSEFAFIRKANGLLNAMDMFNADQFLKEFETEILDNSGFSNWYNVSADRITFQGMEYVLFSAVNNTKFKDAEYLFLHQLDQQKLIADISQELNSPHFYTKLDHILRMLGEHTGVSRVYIFEDSDQGTITNNTYEWCNKGIEPQISMLQGISYEMIPSWRKILIEEGRVFSRNILELPEDLLAVLEPQGIKSILIFPLYAEGNFIGFIGFDECTRNKDWRSDELDLLKLISNILSNALDRRIMLAKITEKQIRLELAVGNANEGIWDWNIKTNEVLFDKTWTGMLGYLTDELETDISAWQNLLHPDDKIRVLTQLEDHMSGRADFFESTYRMLTKSGKWKWILDKGKIIAYDHELNPTRAIGKHTDLTEIKLTEEKLKAGLEKEREMNELKSRFIAHASHEFRTPLASILLICDVLKQYWTKLDALQVETRIRKIMDQAAHLTGIVNKVFEISQFQERLTSFNPQQVDIVALCKSIIYEFNSEPDFKNRVTFYSPMESLTMYLDQVLISRALNSIISNALKYSLENTFVQVKLSENLKEIQLQVKDKGIGIPLEEQKHLFQPFFRAGNIGNIPGNGLGLSIAKESILLHGGNIKVCSSPGKSSTFIICLPKERMDVRKQV
jgi:PAS domain S-box-containing protein